MKNVDSTSVGRTARIKCRNYGDSVHTGALIKMSHAGFVEAWDPLEPSAGIDLGLVIAAKKRDIANILRSYTGYYDLFSELIQNALDAVERRLEEDEAGYAPRIWIEIDLGKHEVRVTDNGCGMSLEQFRQFLSPSFSFKNGQSTRGSKGVGATYLGYGFNSLHVSSRQPEGVFSGKFENGRNWIEDRLGTIARPKIVPALQIDGQFSDLDRGTAVAVMLNGANIRPKNLSWYQAVSATQWLALLRIFTPLGGLYIDGSSAPLIDIKVKVVSADGVETISALDRPHYLYPHEVISRSGNMIELMKDENRRFAQRSDLTKVPPKFKGLNGLWGRWSAEELLGKDNSLCPIRLQLDVSERDLAEKSGLSIYIYMAFSTDLWDALNDKNLELRKGSRVLRGGLQLATRHMPQGMSLTIPMTNNVGFQNLAHVIIHFEEAEPDLGRKGFQPEFVHLAEKVSVSAVTAFRKRYNLLRKPGVASIFNDEIKVDQWIKMQEEHEKNCSLIISGPGLFLPTEELPIRSEPLVEQDVVALFNQMLSSGVIRGVQLIASSQYNQYDGLYRIRMDPPFEKFVRNDINPLGIDSNHLSGDEPYVSKVKVLEYKYNLDGLVEELQSGVKNVNDIGLAVAWNIGKKWREMFDVTSLLDEDTVHHRKIHGTTHSFTHSVSGLYAFEAIILHDLVRYLQDPHAEMERQRELLLEE